MTIAAGKMDRSFETKRISIRRFREEDCKALLPLFTDHEIMYYYIPDEIQLQSEAELREYLQDWDDAETCFLYSCFVEKELIAILSLEKFSLTHRHTELGIALTRQDFRGKGYATEILQTMLEYLFNVKRLHKIFIRYIEGNEASLRLFERFGFQEEGCFREHIRKADGYVNLHYMSLLRSEWQTFEIDGELPNN